MCFDLWRSVMSVGRVILSIYRDVRENYKKERTATKSALGRLR